MASTAVHIPNTLEAIRSGVIPGAFGQDRTEFAFPTLAYVGARGATHFWTIRVRLLRDDADDYVPIEDEMLDQPLYDLAGYRAEITVESQQAGGKVRDTVPTYVLAGKNLGKKSATNALTQALRNALGLYNKQRKRADITDAPAAAPPAEAEAETDADAEAEFDSMPPPMLVKKIGDTREATLTPETFAKGVTVQRKLNGVRYVVFARTGPGGRKRVVRYSRTGTEYPGQDQVAGEILPMLVDAPRIAPGQYGLPAAPNALGTMAFQTLASRDRQILAAYGADPDSPGDPAPYFDGELYLHGKSLNWISGQARRGDDEGILVFNVFDVFFPYAKAAGHDMESRHRQAYLDAFFARADAAGLAHPHVVRVESFPVRDMAGLDELAKRFLREGYEGAIARKDDAGYRYSYQNYHAPALVKIKPKHDAEFAVVGFTQGTRGKDVGAVIWECEVPDPVDPRDRTFTVVPKDLTYEDRYAIFECLGRQVEGPGGVRMTRFERDVKGLPLTVEFAERSVKTGKPLQAKALVFRTYEGGPDADPIRKILMDCKLPE